MGGIRRTLFAAGFFGCLATASAITVRNPGAGHYAILMTAAAAAQNATLTFDALLGTTVQATRTLTRAFARQSEKQP